jgi:HAD superfamily hydrolase (TIGR01459 family)
MGIADDLYTGIMTSGEATCLNLAQRSDPWFRALGDRVYFLGPERDEGIVREAGLTLVQDPQGAEFVVVAGPDDLDGPSEIAEHEPVLLACRAAGLPMICANPDLLIVRDGETIICAGSLATRYEELGGEVRWVGKPDAGIYVPVMDMLAVAPDRAVMVGDSLRTDVAGAAASGLSSCWVLSGIHGDDVDGDPARAEAVARAANLVPTYTVPTFVW